MATSRRRRSFTAGIDGREIGGWRDYREIADPPDTDFFRRAHAAGNAFVPTWALTVFKFPSAMRPGSYREKRSDEQAACAERMSQAADLPRSGSSTAVVASRLRHSRCGLRAA